MSKELSGPPPKEGYKSWHVKGIAKNQASGKEASSLPVSSRIVCGLLLGVVGATNEWAGFDMGEAHGHPFLL
jgi:hypothetical protein